MASTAEQRTSRAVKKEVEEGRNPLNSAKFQRWEDQVGVDRIINRRVLELEPLPTPAQVLGELPLSRMRRILLRSRAMRFVAV